MSMPKFKRVGSDHRGDLAGGQFVFDLSPFGGEIPATVRTHHSVVECVNPPPHIACDQLGAFAALGKGDGAVAGVDQGGNCRSRLRVCGAAGARRSVEQRRVEQRKRAGAMR